MIILRKHAVTHCSITTWEILAVAVPERNCGETQQLLWPVFASPDISTLYGNVAAAVPEVFFRHMTEMGGRIKDEG